MINNQPDPFFIDENINVFEGEDAQSRLKEKSDLRYADAESGITHVELSRWQEAQRYELRTWLSKYRSAADDRNKYHKIHFANYASLRGQQFSRGVELGCGPFTNMRLILSECNITDITLLDPLLSDYLKHPFCSYKHGRLGGLLRQKNNWQRIFSPKSYLDDCLTAYRVGRLLGRPVRLIKSMIETYETDLQFDFVVMINVLEHCQDAAKVFEKVLELLSPGGIFVFADVKYEAKKVLQISSITYDAGHPLKVDHSIIDQFLDKQFDILMRAEYRQEMKFRGVYDETYFIGKRL
jgi:SAM-dependent methyltransferase